MLAGKLTGTLTGKLTGNITSGMPLIDSDAAQFIMRVEADGGTVEDVYFLDSFFKDAKANGYFNDIVAAYSPSWGVKGTTTASKLYSIIGAAQDLEQTTGSKQAAITSGLINGRTGIVFDGADDVYAQTFTFIRPETVIMMGIKQISWTNIDFLFDGNAAQTGGVRQVTSTPMIEQRVAGISGPSSTDLAVNTAGHLRCLFNHPTSNIIQVDNNAETSTPIASAVDMDGFTIGARGDEDAWSNISTGAIVLLKSAVDANYAAKMAAIYTFSKSAYGTP